MAQYSMVNGTVQFQHEGENTTHTTTVPASVYRARPPRPQPEHLWGLSETGLELLFWLFVVIDFSAVYVKYRWRRYACGGSANLGSAEDLE